MADVGGLFHRTVADSLDRGGAAGDSAEVICGYAAFDLRRLSQVTKPDALKVFLPGTPHNHRSPPG